LRIFSRQEITVMIFRGLHCKIFSAKRDNWGYSSVIDCHIYRRPSPGISRATRTPGSFELTDVSFSDVLIWYFVLAHYLNTSHQKSTVTGRTFTLAGPCGALEEVRQRQTCSESAQRSAVSAVEFPIQDSRGAEYHAAPHPRGSQAPCAGVQFDNRIPQGLTPCGALAPLPSATRSLDLSPSNLS